MAAQPEAVPLYADPGDPVTYHQRLMDTVSMLAAISPSALDLIHELAPPGGAVATQAEAATPSHIAAAAITTELLQAGHLAPGVESEFREAIRLAGYEKARDRLRQKLKTKEAPKPTAVSAAAASMAKLSVDELVSLIEPPAPAKKKKRKKSKKRRKKKKPAEAAASAPAPLCESDEAVGAGGGAASPSPGGAAATHSPGASDSGSCSPASDDARAAAEAAAKALAGLKVHTIKEKLATGDLGVDVDLLFNEDAFEDDDDDDAEVEAFRRRLGLM